MLPAKIVKIYEHYHDILHILRS